MAERAWKAVQRYYWTGCPADLCAEQTSFFASGKVKIEDANRNSALIKLGKAVEEHCQNLSQGGKFVVFKPCQLGAIELKQALSLSDSARRFFLRAGDYLGSWQLW